MKTRQTVVRPGVVSAAEMRAIEAAAIASGRVSGQALMTKAGEETVEAILLHWPELGAGPWRSVVLCGPGNNGGDCYVVARLLAGLGHGVTVFALGDPGRLPADARANHALWSTMGPVGSMTEAAQALAGADLVVDALFGIGLTRGLDDALGQIFAAVPALARRVSVDVPSGRDTDSGAVLGEHAFPADLTVTFHAAKPVHQAVIDAGCQVVVADIGL